ncbi:Acetyl-CoA dehydrogenase C-terminal like [Nocardia amikacinitolerans]|nr:Acetyl-CoA dehydrogenase C-terminal like [Nocardia amikacinitolerans]
MPKFHFDPHTGELGERNGVFVTNVEHKMGLKVSATCELTFGGHGIPAKGWLVGDVHNGIAQMFKVIENARMQVGTKAISTLSTGYLNALEYAKTRVQGPDLTQMADKTAPRVAIVRHPDVRRSLMMQKAYQGAALAHLQDQISEFLQRDNGDPRSSESRVALATALGDVRAMTECLIGYLMAAQEQPRELYKIGLGSVRFLLAFGDLMIGWRLLEQAEIALAALACEPSQEDRAFYEGKVAVADFFSRTVLPDLSSARRVVTSVTGTVMDLPDGAF